MIQTLYFLKEISGLTDGSQTRDHRNQNPHSNQDFPYYISNTYVIFLVVSLGLRHAKKTQTISKTYDDLVHPWLCWR